MRTCLTDFETASRFDDWANLSTLFSWYLLLRSDEAARLRLAKRIAAARRAAEIAAWQHPKAREMRDVVHAPRPAPGMTP